MAPVDDARSLLALALEDAAAFRVLISSGSVRPATALFHAQQAVEKAIKAVLVLTESRTAGTMPRRARVPGGGGRSPPPPFAIDRLIRPNPFVLAFRDGDPAVDLLEPEEAEEVVASVTAWAAACIRAMADRESAAG